VALQPGVSYTQVATGIKQAQENYIPRITRYIIKELSFPPQGLAFIFRILRMDLLPAGLSTT